METNTTKREYKQALESGKLLVIGTKYTSNGWTEFRLVIPKSDKHRGIWYKPVIVTDSGHYKKDAWDYKCTAWGTDRRLEVVLGVGYALGLEFNEIRQNYQWIQG